MVIIERVILHSDCNSFYASVECLHHPEIRNKPVAVGGDVEQRHGIILAKNQLAKKYNIKTGEALWQAKRKCPELVILPPNYHLYMRFSKLARQIYWDYTDQVEPFGLDECWLDVTGSTVKGDGLTIAVSSPQFFWLTDSFPALIRNKITPSSRILLGGITYAGL